MMRKGKEKIVVLRDGDDWPIVVEYKYTPPSRYADRHEHLGQAAAEMLDRMTPGERRRWLARQRRGRG